MEQSMINYVNQLNFDMELCLEERHSVELFDAVIHGSYEDVQSILKQDSDFWDVPYTSEHTARYNCSQIIAFACRYGGVDKLKSLLDCERFSNAYSIHCKSTVLGYFIHEKMYLWLSGYLFYRAHKLDKLLPLGADNEVIGALPLCEEERIKCIELLIQRRLLDSAGMNLLCFYALMAGDCKIVSYLRSQGAELRLLTDFSTAKHSEERQILVSAFEQQPKGVVMFAKLAYDDQCSLKLALVLLLKLFKEYRELFFELLDYLDIADSHLDELVIECMKNRSAESIRAFIKSGKLDNKERLERYIDKANSLEAAEITAMLLDYHNQTYGNMLTDLSL